MIGKIKNNIKNITITALELAQVRLNMACIELAEQKNYLLVTLGAVFLTFIFLLVALFSLLLGLDNLLEPQTKITLFFVICGGAFVFALITLFIMLKSLKKQRYFMASTLTEIKRDIAALKQAVNTPRERE